MTVLPLIGPTTVTLLRFMHWTNYSNIASIYANAGLNEKAESALKEIESKMDMHCLPAFHYPISLYGRTSNLVEVYLNYLNMNQALVKLGDLPGAENCFKEWEADCPKYDMRLSNVLIGAYVKAGEIEKAETVGKRAVSRRAMLNTKTWEIFFNYCFATKQFNVAVKCMENAISSYGKRDKNNWCPAQEMVEAVMTYFEEKLDVDGTENLVEILKKVGTVNSAVNESLIRTYFAVGKRSLDMQKVGTVNSAVNESLNRTYFAVGKRSLDMHQRLETENLKVKPETEKMLQSISVE